MKISIEELTQFKKDVDDKKFNFTNIQLNNYISDIIKINHKRVRDEITGKKRRMNDEECRCIPEYQLFLSVYRDTELYKKYIK